MRPSKGHSLPGDHAGWDNSGHEKKMTECEALTSWRPASGGTSQDTEEKVENHKISDTEVVADPVVLVIILFQ